MLSVILISLPVLLVLDGIVAWVVWRRATAQVEASVKRDEAFANVSNTISVYLAATFVVLFTVYFFWLRNPWQSLLIAVIVGIINSLITFMLLALIAKR